MPLKFHTDLGYILGSHIFLYFSGKNDEFVVSRYDQGVDISEEATSR